MKKSAIEESVATDMQQLLKRLASPDFLTNKKTKTKAKQDALAETMCFFKYDLCLKEMLGFFG